MADVTIYTTKYCPFCFAAKRLLKGVGIEYREIPLDSDPELRAQVSEGNGGWRTVPMIFVGERFIGGYREISALHRDGSLLELLADVEVG